MGRNRRERATQSEEMVRKHENESAFRKPVVARGWKGGPGEGWAMIPKSRSG